MIHLNTFSFSENHTNLLHKVNCSGGNKLSCTPLINDVLFYKHKYTREWTQPECVKYIIKILIFLFLFQIFLFLTFNHNL